ncbi:MAG: hypothetical protein ABSH46_16460 [Bryobacteraceae bacterium]|jgi:hypothetical protein
MLMSNPESQVPALPPLIGGLPHEVSLNASGNLEELIEHARMVPTNAIVDAPSAWQRGSLSATSVWMRVVWQRIVPPSTDFHQ